MGDAEDSVLRSAAVSSQRGLKVRHLTMMGLGSAIGAGLFLGSGQGIAVAGPGILVSYVLAGIIVVLVMRMLGEMGSAIPHSSSFSYYAKVAIGRGTGFVMGWLYWYLLVLVLGAELTGASQIIASWTNLPSWIPAAVAVMAFAAINLAQVRHFGEFEFWFAAIKVVVIIGFIGLGTMLVLGLLPGTEFIGLKNLTVHGGFLPKGWSGVGAGLLIVAFAFGGIELVTIAAAESEDPKTAIGKAVTSVIWRISVFYLGSILIMILVLPWNDSALVSPAGPFSAVLSLTGIPYASRFIEVIVVLALLSAFNAQIYATSRMSSSLSQRGDGPAFLGKLDKNNVPRNAVLLSVAISVLGVVLNYLDQGWLLNFLLQAVGAALLVIWVFIAISELRLRPRLAAEGKIVVKMWCFPYLSILALVLLGFLTGLMLIDAQSRMQLLGLTVVIILLYLAYYGHIWWHGKEEKELK